MKLPITTASFLLALAVAVSLGPTGALAHGASSKLVANNSFAASRDSLSLRADIGADLKARVSGDKDKNDKKSEEERKDDGENAKVILFNASSTAVASATVDASRIEKKLENGNADRGWHLGFLKGWFHFGKGKATTSATSSPDTAKPDLRSVHVSAKSTTTATISWRTDEPASIVIRYGTSSPVTATSSSVSVAMNATSSATLTGLMPGTKYRYVLVATDASGNVRTTAEKEFKTENAPATPDTTSPKISFAIVLRIKADFARIIWLTNEPSDSKVWISTDANVSTSGTVAYSSSERTRFHSAELTNLNANTKYYFTLSSTDASGNVNVSTGSSFTTDSR